MVIRVVSAFAVLATASAAAAQTLPYEIANLTGVPASAPPVAARAPFIGYDMAGLLYDRMPDHHALGYDMERITGGVATHRTIRDYGPLDYDIEGLVRAIDADSFGRPTMAMAD